MLGGSENDSWHQRPIGGDLCMLSAKVLLIQASSEALTE